MKQALLFISCAVLVGLAAAVVIEQENGALESNVDLDSFRFEALNDGAPPPPASGAAPPPQSAGAAAPKPAGGGAPPPAAGGQAPAPAAPAVNKVNAVGGALGAVTDPLSLGAAPPGTENPGVANALPPFAMMHSDVTVSPAIAKVTTDGLANNLALRIKQAEDLLNRMTWQINRETSWANSVHDIIQNYQYKYTRVLSKVKKHSSTVKKMRDLVKKLKQAQMHEILQQDLSKATKELTELASASSETSEDENSYQALKDRVALLLADMQKMAKKKVNVVAHKAQDAIKKIEQEAVPPASTDTLKSLNIGGK